MPPNHRVGFYSMTVNRKRSSAPTSLDLQVVERIKSLRVQRGLSQSVVAEHLGIVHQQYHKYEAGLNRVSAGMLIKLAEILDCSVSDMIPPDMRAPGNMEAEIRIDVLKQELVNMVLDCSDEQRLAAIRTLMLEN